MKIKFENGGYPILFCTTKKVFVLRRKISSLKRTNTHKRKQNEHHLFKPTPRHSHKQNKQSKPTQTKQEQHLKLFDHVLSFNFFLGYVLGHSNLASRTTGTKTSAQGARQNVRTFPFRIGSDDTKYLCSNCRKDHDPLYHCWETLTVC